MDRARAIQLAERWSEGCLCTLRHGEAKEYHKLCLAALREQEQREQGCEFCLNGEHPMWAPNEQYTPMTNADRIRAMSDEDLAWELMVWRCEAVARHHGVESEYPDTQKTILDWLKQPYGGADHE